MTMGESARNARKNAGLSMTKLAEMSGVSTSTIFNTEKDLRTPSVLIAEALAMALNISIEEYIGSEIDCVHVVRCKECKHLEKGCRFRNPLGASIYDNDYMLVEPEDFCSYGERRTDG